MKTMGHRAVGTLGLVTLLAGCPVTPPGSTTTAGGRGGGCATSGCVCSSSDFGCNCTCGGQPTTRPPPPPSGGSSSSSSSGGVASSDSGDGAVPVMVRENTFTTNNLYGVHGAGGVLVAVGQHGTIVRRKAGGWVADVSPTQEDLWAVSLSSASNGIAVGRNGVMLKLQDGVWALLPTHTTTSLNAVWTAPGGAAWAAGGTAGGDGVLLRYNGFTWWRVETPQPLPALYALTHAGGLDAWGAGANGAVVRLPVTGMVTVERVPQDTILDAWTDTVGNGFWVTLDGVILRLEAQQFSVETTGHPALLGVAGFQRVVAVGEAGTVLARIHGGWVTVPSGSSRNLWDVHVDEEDVAWVVGDHGEIYRLQ